MEIGASSKVASPGVALLKQGVKPWNEWRNGKDGSPDLSGADLRNCDLTGADLRGANLSNAILRGAKLGPGTFLWNANLSGADLYQANLRGADLQDVNFSGADLFQADLRESNLQGADLSKTKGGLLSKQLAGSDLTGAKLPEPLAKLYDGLSQVKEISDSAQKLFLALLVGCLYSWLTIAQTTDVELITNRATTPLPIIQAAIPIVGFYVVAPLILLCLYFYFHFYLQKLWEELGSLPAVFTDGRELHKRTDPWLLNDLVRSHFIKLKDGRPFLSYFQAWVSVVLAWWLVPITLLLFWGRYLRRHDLFWTTVHALLLALALYSAVRLYRIAGETLRENERKVFNWKDIIKRRTTYLHLGSAIVLSALLIAISLGAVFGEPNSSPQEGAIQCMMQYSRLPRAWVPCAMKLVGYSPFLDLINADISTKPPNWIDKKDEELELVKGANLENSDLHNANAEGAFLVKANLRNSHLEHIFFVRADLRQSYLRNAHLKDAWLLSARLNKANMFTADLESAVLDFADLTDASVSDSNLRSATLRAAELSEANLRGTDLSNTQLASADLQRANFGNANLAGANLGGAVVSYANFRNTRGLTEKMIRTTYNWQLAFYSPDMLKQLGLPPDHNKKLQKQMEAEQQAKTAADVPAPPTANAKKRKPTD